MIINKIHRFCIHLFQLNSGYLLEILPTNFKFLKAFNSEFSYVEICFADHNSKRLEIEGKINTTLVFK